MESVCDCEHNISGVTTDYRLDLGLNSDLIILTLVYVFLWNCGIQTFWVFFFLIVIEKEKKYIKKNFFFNF